MYIQNPYRFGVSGVDFTGAGAIYSLRKFFGWGNAVLKIRRSSDDETAFLFFNGSSSSDLITTSSYISLTSNTTPDTSPNVTLATWIGSNDGFVEDWIPQIPDGNIDSDLFMFQASGAFQPQIVTAGAIITENSLPAVDFNGVQHLTLVGTHIPALGSLGGDQANTVLTVSNLDNSNGIGTVFSATISASRKHTIFNDTRTNKNVSFIATADGNFFATLLSREASTSYRLLTVTINGSKKVTSFFNATEQNNITFTNTYENGVATIGSQQGSSTRIDGRIAEVIIFPTDKTADLTNLHGDINTYYSIY